jgi:hypothetical protein
MRVKPVELAFKQPSVSVSDTVSLSSVSLRRDEAKGEWRAVKAQVESGRTTNHADFARKRRKRKGERVDPYAFQASCLYFCNFLQFPTPCKALFRDTDADADTEQCSTSEVRCTSVQLVSLTLQRSDFCPPFVLQRTPLRPTLQAPCTLQGLMQTTQLTAEPDLSGHP